VHGTARVLFVLVAEAVRVHTHCRLWGSRAAKEALATSFHFLFLGTLTLLASLFLLARRDDRTAPRLVFITLALAFFLPRRLATLADHTAQYSHFTFDGLVLLGEAARFARSLECTNLFDMCREGRLSIC
jgi:hypothetical protein